MDINKNSYIFLFSAVMVVVSALMLSTAAISLKDLQDRNIELEKKQSILATLRINVSRDESESFYAKLIKDTRVVSPDGSLRSSIDAFSIDLASELAKPENSRNLPLYVAEKDSATFFVVPVRGKGLWGPIWGYISVQEDLNTVYGAFFDHKSETPGLGAEISTEIFEPQFEGKKIISADQFKSIEVRKGDASGDFQVNGISGGTITSKGVEAMLYDCLKLYQPYFKNLAAPKSSSIDSVGISENLQTIKS